MSKFILPLDSEEATWQVAGGRGSNLAGIARAGFSVPPGFIITIAAYRAFLQTNKLQEALIESHQADHGGISHAKSASRSIQKLFEKGIIPAGVKQDIVAAYQQLGRMIHEDGDEGMFAGPSVAVRSSAMIEDLAGASSAGQQDTFLNIQGEDRLLATVKQCWSSLWSTRATACRVNWDMNQNRFELAVLVQQMVPAEVAGVLHTIDQITGDLAVVVVNATWGLGKGIADGLVTPDLFVVDKSTGRLRKSMVGDKHLMIVPSAGSTSETPVAPHRRSQPSIDEEQLAELVRLGCALESHKLQPQDVEWAISRNKIFVLQSRRSTNRSRPRSAPSAGDLSVPGDDDWPAIEERPSQDFDLWTQVNVGEVWPHPVSPLLWSGVPYIVSGGIHYALRGLNSPAVDSIQWARRFYGRVYYNEGALIHVFSEELGLPGSFVDAALGSRREVENMISDRFRPIHFLRRLPFLVRMTRTQLDTGRELEQLFPQIDAQVASFMNQDFEQLDDRQLWDQFLIWVDRFIHVMNLHTELSSSSITAFALLERLTKRWLGRKELAHDLITGLSGVHSARMGTQLWHMARTLSEAGLSGIVTENEPQQALQELKQTPAARPVVKMLDSFLQHYGHHCPNEGEWLYPRWGDDPKQVVKVLASYLKAFGQLDPIQAEVQQRQRRHEAVVWARAHLDPIRRVAMEFLLTRVRRLVRLRDNGKNCYMKALHPIRHCHAQFGRRWADRGWINRSDDIFFLSIPEVEYVIECGDPAAAGLDLVAIAADRSKSFDHWFTVEAPEVINADGKPIAFGRTNKPFKPIFRGTPASPGRALGTARIIHSPQQAHPLQRGDILVTRAADPGWTLWFPLVSGLIMEIGGQLSHAAIAAREYGLPVVVNVPGITQQLRNGQTILIDGSRGIIKLHEAEATSFPPGNG